MLNYKPITLWELRKKNRLMLSDVAFLLKTDASNLSKYEREIALPPLDVILSYHLLFDIPLNLLIEEHLEEMKEFLKDRAFKLLDELSNQSQTAKVERRKKALDGIISGLMPYEEEYEGDA